jgi:hypothetical protein
MPSLGCLIDEPVAIEARNDPRNYSMADLIVTEVPVPDTYDCDLGPTLDQDGVGACVAFAATSIRSHQEHIDEGSWEFDTAAAFKAYRWLKEGHGAYPGDGIPSEGSYPKAVWTLAKVEGIPGRDGNARRIAAYYQLQGTPGSAAWVATQQQVILQFGPVSVSSAWPGNWWTCGASGLLPYPSGNAGGHMFVKKGWWLSGAKGALSGGMSPTGRYWRYRQSWGADSYTRRDRFGRAGEFLLPFEADTEYPRWGEGGEIWKTVDVKDDDPTPGGKMVPVADKAARMLSIPAATQLFDISTGAPLVKMSAAAKVHSPFAVNATQYAVVVTTGGVTQLARVNKADASLVASSLLT